MADPIITPPPIAPNRREGFFNERMDAFLAWLVTSQSEMAAVIAWMGARVAENAGAAQAAETARQAAEAAANSAEVSAGASAHVPNAAYDAGAKVWSNVDFQTYRAKTDHSDVAADPSADKVNWAGLSSPDAVAKRARNFSLWTGA
ncbi:hypothetical protein [Pseudophaeobacter sp.]|uniref:hypothetical protein n=1 Tax=Pseudophaeobacter sp. TaxID=1971739 RepID=UPI0032984F67